jgi:hypothetical protein
VNPGIFIRSPGSVLRIAYILTNAVIGGIIGLGLASGLAVGDRLAAQLERARYV